MAIYFDNSATTQPFDFVAQRMQTYMTQSYYNPSALYAPAVEVAQNLRKVRRDFARDLFVQEDEIYFTSGGTESNNTVILGTVLARRGPLHLITTAVEHSSVYEAFLRLEKYGHHVEFLPTDANGCVRMEDLRRALRPDTALVSIMHVNNESGAINDIASLSGLTKQLAPHCIFHRDGVQAYLKVPFVAPQVDAYSISAHKFHAPRGVGVLMCKKTVRIDPVITGGPQEGGMRAGTENTMSIVAMGEAQQYYLAHQKEHIDRILSVKRRLVQGLSNLPGVRFNGPAFESAAPQILSVSFENIRGETLLHALEEKGIYVGTGSACSSRKKGKNRILAAMGVPAQVAQGTIRFSFGCMNTTEESEIVAQEVVRAVTHLRRFVRR